MATIPMLRRAADRNLGRNLSLGRVCSSLAKTRERVCGRDDDDDDNDNDDDDEV